MVSPIPIDSTLLKNWYLDQKLSTYAIAKKFNCDPTVIQNRLKKEKIPLRSPKIKIEIEPETLYELYVTQQLSTYRIAKVLNVGRTTIQKNLEKNNILTRKNKRVFISKPDLEQHYLISKESMAKIAKHYGVTPSVILDKLRKNKIQSRSSSESLQKYPRFPFNGNLAEKAYLIGFRLGDLHCFFSSNETVKIKSGTTKPAQLALLNSIFSKYGPCYSYSNGCFSSFECSLDLSFSFLVPKNDLIEEWIVNDNYCFMAFLAGYVDAEGTIKIYDHRARFRIGSYDYGILDSIHEKLSDYGVRSTFNLERVRDDKNHGDFWRINISDRESLLKVFNLIEPHMHHQDRLNDLQKAKENVVQRLRR